MLKKKKNRNERKYKTHILNSLKLKIKLFLGIFRGKVYRISTILAWPSVGTTVGDFPDKRSFIAVKREVAKNLFPNV